MTTAALGPLFEQCRTLGIRLRADGDAMRYSAPKGAMTPEVLDRLKANKPALLAALAQPGARTSLSPAALAELPAEDWISPVVTSSATPQTRCNTVFYAIS